MDDEVTFDAARRAALDQFIVEEELPDAFRAVFLEWYAGITAHLAEWGALSESAQDCPPFVPSLELIAIDGLHCRFAD